MLALFSQVFAALTFVVLGDAAGKTLTGLGFSPFFVAWTRFALAAIVLLPLSGLKRSELRHLADWRILLRAGLIAGGICSILTALRTEPIANVFGAFFIGPGVSYLLSILLLGERVTPLRSILLALGFVGVLLVVKPGFGATPGIGFAVLAGVFYGSYLTATRWLAVSYRPRFLLLSQLMIGGLLLAPLGLTTQIPSISPTALWLITGSALGSAAGNFILVMVNRTTPASLVAPLVYTQLIAATAVGYLIFGDWPDLVSFAGLAIILISGLLSLRAAFKSQA